MKTKLLLAGLIAMGGLALAGCSTSPNVKGLSSASARRKVADEALSIVSLLDSDGGNNALKRSMKAGDISSITEAEIVEIKTVLGQVDTILANQTGVTSEILESDNSLYQSKMVVTYTDIFAKLSSFDLYFNSKVVDQNEYKNDDDSDEVDTHSDKDDENEITTRLDGILLDNEESYNFIALIEEEVEADESETEVHFELSNDSGFYVKAIQENEVESDEVESKIAYSVYQDNVLVSSYSLKVEQEQNEETEICLKMNGKSYQIEQLIQDGKEFLKVRYTSQTSSARLLFEKVVTVDKTSGTSSVEFVLIK